MELQQVLDLQNFGEMKQHHYYTLEIPFFWVESEWFELVHVGFNTTPHTPPIHFIINIFYFTFSFYNLGPIIQIQKSAGPLSSNKQLYPNSNPNQGG